MRNIIIVAVACLALVACKTTEEAFKESGKKPLSSTQIKQLLTDKSVDGESSGGYPFKVRYTADGKAILESNKYDETGKWWVEGKDLYCSQYPSVRGGKKGCRRLYDLGDKYQMVDLEGAKSSTLLTVQ